MSATLEDGAGRARGEVREAVGRAAGREPGAAEGADDKVAGTGKQAGAGGVQLLGGNTCRGVSWRYHLSRFGDLTERGFRGRRAGNSTENAQGASSNSSTSMSSETIIDPPSHFIFAEQHASTDVLAIDGKTIRCIVCTTGDEACSAAASGR
jgi:uncharacterized protein YjbJ (UPF0337 family)